MKLDLEFSAVTRLKDWWKTVLNNFSVIESEYNATTQRIDESISKNTSDLSGRIDKLSFWELSEDADIDTLSDGFYYVYNNEKMPFAERGILMHFKLPKSGYKFQLAIEETTGISINDTHSVYKRWGGLEWGDWETLGHKKATEEDISKNRENSVITVGVLRTAVESVIGKESELETENKSVIAAINEVLEKVLTGDNDLSERLDTVNESLLKEAEERSAKDTEFTGRIAALESDVTLLKGEDVNTSNMIGYLDNSLIALTEQVGNIDTALDNIISIQNSYIGGDSE